MYCGSRVSDCGCREYSFKDIAAEAAWSAEADRSAWAISVGCSRENLGMASVEDSDDVEPTPTLVAAASAELSQTQPMWRQTMTHPVASLARRRLLAARAPVGQQQPGALRVWLADLAASTSAWWRSRGPFSRASGVRPALQDLKVSHFCAWVDLYPANLPFGSEDCR